MITEIEADFATLDVKRGRQDLNDHFKDRPKLGECPPEMRVPIVIRGYIDDVISHDDGVSREFGVQIEALDFPGRDRVKELLEHNNTQLKENRAQRRMIKNLCMVISELALNRNDDYLHPGDRLMLLEALGDAK